MQMAGNVTAVSMLNDDVSELVVIDLFMCCRCMSQWTAPSAYSLACLRAEIIHADLLFVCVSVVILNRNWLSLYLRIRVRPMKSQLLK